MERVIVNFKKLTPDAILPTRGSEEAAGWDLYNNDQDYIINPGETVKVSTGISIALPDNTFGGIYARSGLATKHGIAPANMVGVIDSDYRGPIIVALHNYSSNSVGITKGDRIAQLIVQPYIPIEFNEVEDLDETARGEGSFGSTGTGIPMA